MLKGNYLSPILRSKKTVFSTKDIALLWHDANSLATRVRLNYYVNKGELLRLRKGLYAKNKDYDRIELATRILTPAYVSFETVLVREGVIFQYYTEIFVASYATRKITVDDQVFLFRKLRTDLLVNPLGVEHVNETSIASMERAFLVLLYVSPRAYFDYLGGIDWEKVNQILPIYENKSLEKRVARCKLRTESKI